MHKYLEERRLALNEMEMKMPIFFRALRTSVLAVNHRFEHMQISDSTVQFLSSTNDFTENREHFRNFADVFIAASQYQQHVKAVAHCIQQNKDSVHT